MSEGLWKVGVNYASDSILLKEIAENKYKIMLITRQSGELAFAGGFHDDNEDPLDAAVRELNEETGNEQTLAFDFLKERAKLVYQGIVNDPRNTDDRWIETYAYLYIVTPTEASAITLKGSDDAIGAQWYDLDEILANDTLYADHHRILKEGLKGIIEGL